MKSHNLSPLLFIFLIKVLKYRVIFSLNHHQYIYLREKGSNLIRNFYIFIIHLFWLCWVFVAEPGLPLVELSCGYSSLRHTGLWRLLFLHRAWALVTWTSVVVAHRLVSMLRSMWDLPWPGIEPMSPALAGRSPSTVPPGKSQELSIR